MLCCLIFYFAFSVSPDTLQSLVKDQEKSHAEISVRQSYITIFFFDTFINLEILKMKQVDRFKQMTTQFDRNVFCLAPLKEKL